MINLQGRPDKIIGIIPDSKTIAEVPKSGWRKTKIKATNVVTKTIIQSDNFICGFRVKYAAAEIGNKNLISSEG